MADNLADYLGTTALAVGALGAAAYGVVDGLKLVPWIDLAGFEKLFSRAVARGRAWVGHSPVGLDALMPALTAAYGQDAMALLKAQYRAGRGSGELPRTLRQGVRIGFGLLPAGDIAGIAERLGIAPAVAALAAEAVVLSRSLRPPALGELPPAAPTGPGEEQRAALARLENAIDARIDAALQLAERQYVTQTKVLAMLVALAIAFGVGLSLGVAPIVCFMVGIAAVPLAPVAKDLATALNAAVQAFRGRGA